MLGIRLLAEKPCSNKMGSTLFVPMRCPIKIAQPRLIGTRTDSKECMAVRPENKVAKAYFASLETVWSQKRMEFPA